MPGYKGWEGELPLGKQLKECLDETWFEDLAKSDKPDVAQWAKNTIETYNKLMDKYYYGPVDEGKKSNFSERLIKCFGLYGDSYPDDSYIDDSYEVID